MYCRHGKYKGRAVTGVDEFSTVMELPNKSISENKNIQEDTFQECYEPWKKWNRVFVTGRDQGCYLDFFSVMLASFLLFKFIGPGSPLFTPKLPNTDGAYPPNTEPP